MGSPTFSALAPLSRHRLDLLRIQLLLYSLFAGFCVPTACAIILDTDAYAALYWLIVLVLMAALAMNAAWRLHLQGRPFSPLAGSGLALASLLALWVGPDAAGGGTNASDVIQVTATLQLASGLLLAALQAQVPEPPIARLRQWLHRRFTLSASVLPAESPDSVTRPPHSPAHRLAKNNLDTLLAVALLLNALALTGLVALIVGGWNDLSEQFVGVVPILALVVVAMVVLELLLWRVVRRSHPQAVALAPPVFLLLTAAPAVILLGGIEPSAAPLPTLIAGLLTLVACRWFLRARSRASSGILGRTGRRGSSLTASLNMETTPARVTTPVGSLAKPWSPFELWIMYAAFPFIWLAISLVMVSLARFGGAGEDVTALASLEAEVLTLWVVLLFLVRRKGLPWSILGLRPFPTRMLLAIPATSALEFAAVGVFNSALLPVLPALQAYQASLDADLEPSSALSFGLVLLGGVIVAPVVEELLDRGFFFTGFRSYIGPLGAAVLSALLFGLSHAYVSLEPFSLNLHPTQALGAFLGGLVYAGMRHDSDSVFPSMLAHAAWNLMVIL